MGHICQSLVSPSSFFLLALLGESFRAQLELHLLFPLHQAAVLIGPGTVQEWPLDGRAAARGCDLDGKSLSNTQSLALQATTAESFQGK